MSTSKPVKLGMPPFDRCDFLRKNILNLREPARTVPNKLPQKQSLREDGGHRSGLPSRRPISESHRLSMLSAPPPEAVKVKLLPSAHGREYPQHSKPNLSLCPSCVARQQLEKISTETQTEDIVDHEYLLNVLKKCFNSILRKSDDGAAAQELKACHQHDQQDSAEVKGQAQEDSRDDQDGQESLAVMQLVSPAGRQRAAGRIIDAEMTDDELESVAMEVKRSERQVKHSAELPPQTSGTTTVRASRSRILSKAKQLINSAQIPPDVEVYNYSELKRPLNPEFNMQEAQHANPCNQHSVANRYSDRYLHDHQDVKNREFTQADVCSSRLLELANPEKINHSLRRQKQQNAVLKKICSESMRKSAIEKQEMVERPRQHQYDTLHGKFTNNMHRHRNGCSPRALEDTDAEMQETPLWSQQRHSLTKKKKSKGDTSVWGSREDIRSPRPIEEGEPDVGEYYMRAQRNRRDGHKPAARESDYSSPVRSEMSDYCLRSRNIKNFLTMKINSRNLPKVAPHSDKCSSSNSQSAALEVDGQHQYIAESRANSRKPEHKNERQSMGGGNEDPQWPKAQSSLSDTERDETLKKSQIRYKTLVDELNHMSITTETVRLRLRKADIEKELQTLDHIMDQCSRPRVYAKLAD